ncbi:SNF2 family domain-containing protein [Colletotrichum plurivorum]|uniref:SNF2 family domain-containing protein n=1 Tax=Colletotrichum plurivorum TaxID=2175906 RepID=A0A8H6N7Q6_9PEZI|nr:SNF2 family domain-containing protein [Colletotrichum plurivorum]
MTSPRADKGLKKFKSTKTTKDPFEWNSTDDTDSAEEQGDLARNMLTLQKATRELPQSEDVAERFLQNALIDTDGLNEDGGCDTSATRLQEVDDAPELYVSNDEGHHEDGPPQQDSVKIKQEPGLVADFIAIDASQASPDARAKWTKSRKWVIDLTGGDEDEPNGMNSQRPTVETGPRHIEKRMAELAGKLLNGTLSKEGMSELSRLTAKRRSGNDDTPAVMAQVENGEALSLDFNNPAGSSEATFAKPRKTRQPAAKNAAEFFSRQEADEELKQNGKRSAANDGNSRVNKKPKISAKEKRQMAEGARRMQSMWQLTDAIQERADQGDLPDEPHIEARTTIEQLKQMFNNIPEHADKKVIQDQKKELREAVKAWGRDSVHAMNGKWQVRGLQSVLPNHQLVVGAWVLGRELKKTRDLPRGGILADTMRMGKTIETLSCMVGNQASDSLQDEGKGATLVVCQSGQMIDQWMSEIKKHCNRRFSKNILHYKAGNKMDLDLLASFNVVFTSYCQLRDSIPSAKERTRMMGLISDPAKYQNWLDERTGDLFRIVWYRVVLDEAHMIKNYQSHTAYSCGQLEATNRWAVTGTPLINSHQEFFSYLKFIRFNIGDIGDYKREFCKGLLLTHPFLLEGMMGEYFTLEDILTTKERLKLLKGSETVYEQIGSWDQRHKMSDERMSAVFAEAERRKAPGTTGSRLKDVLDGGHMDYDDEIVPVSRAAESASKDPIPVDDDVDEVNSLDDAEEDADGMAPVAQSHVTGNQSSGNGAGIPSGPTRTPRLNPFGISDFGLHFDMDRQLEYLERLELLEISKCIICKKKPVDPRKGKGKARNCPDCRKIVGEPKRLQPFADDDDETDEGSGSDSQSRRLRKKRKDKEYKMGFDFGGFQPEEDDKKDKKPIRFLQVGDRRPDVPVPPSAKTAALKKTILRWQAESPDDKIIIFSQFDVVMKIVGRMLEAEGIQFAYLSGKMTADARTKAVKEFEKGDEVRVLVASLRAGGMALNLTRVNRVILMELWWNHAIEQQAFGRVFRIEQTKETHFLRFIVHTPIEERMLSMQVDKLLAIDEALQDDGTRAPKFSVEDIASLLGKLVKRDGFMQVVPDYSDGEQDFDDVDTPHAAMNSAAAVDEGTYEALSFRMIMKTTTRVITKTDD